jgi:hypothetical protein
MHFRKCSGYAAYPLFAALLFAPLAARAQQQQPTDTTQPQQQPDQTQPQSTPQQRSEVLRQAQERVNARRKVRIRQIIADTYSHKYELDFGGGYLRFRPGNVLQHNTESSWNVDLTDYVRGDLGVTAESRGYYGTAFTGTHVASGLNQAYEVSISQYSFMAGPRYRFYKGLHWGWTGQVEAGVGHGNFNTGYPGLTGPYVGLYPNATVLNVTAGASLDYNLGPGLAFRVTPNYLITNYGSTFQYNAGWNLGMVYRFGRK